MTPQENSLSPYPRLSPEDHHQLLTQTKSFLNLGRILVARENTKKLLEEDGLEEPQQPSSEE